MEKENGKVWKERKSKGAADGLLRDANVIAVRPESRGTTTAHCSSSSSNHNASTPTCKARIYTRTVQHRDRQLPLVWTDFRSAQRNGSLARQRAAHAQAGIPGPHPSRPSSLAWAGCSAIFPHAAQRSACKTDALNCVNRSHTPYGIVLHVCLVYNTRLCPASSVRRSSAQSKTPR